MKTLGVIGGLGPMATAYFLQLLTQMCDADVDQDHMETLIINNPKIPDRTKYILGLNNESPVPGMVAAGDKLREMGAELLAIPCITAHYFYSEIQRQVCIPILHVIRETADYLKNAGIEKIGILATDGTIQSGVIHQCMNENSISCIVPDIQGQNDIMTLIYDGIKAGNRIDMLKFKQVSNDLFSDGAQVILLACTELSLIKRDYKLSAGYLDVMEVLARKAVQCCNRLRKEYNNLITVD